MGYVLQLTWQLHCFELNILQGRESIAYPKLKTMCSFYVVLSNFIAGCGKNAMMFKSQSDTISLASGYNVSNK